MRSDDIKALLKHLEPQNGLGLHKCARSASVDCDTHTQSTGIKIQGVRPISHSIWPRSQSKQRQKVV